MLVWPIIEMSVKYISVIKCIRNVRAKLMRKCMIEQVQKYIWIAEKTSSYVMSVHTLHKHRHCIYCQLTY